MKCHKKYSELNHNSCDCNEDIFILEIRSKGVEGRIPCLIKER